MSKVTLTIRVEEHVHERVKQSKLVLNTTQSKLTARALEVYLAPLEDESLRREFVKRERLALHLQERK